HEKEQEARCADGSGTVRLDGSGAARWLSLAFAVYNPGGSRLRIRINDTTVLENDFGPGRYSFDIPPSEPVWKISLDSSTFVPRSVGLNADGRTLGIYVSRLKLL